MVIFDPNNAKNIKLGDVEIAKGIMFTPQGIINLEGPTSGEYLSSLTMHQGLNVFRQADRQKESLIEITSLPNGKVFIARNEQEIIGYVTFHHPDKHSRWSKHAKVIELGAIEIAKGWRKYKVAHHLLREAFSHEFVNDFIIITTEYCWHWDLRGSNLSLWDYQRMLTKLFSSVGLKKTLTDDPDIMEHPANVLMARYGIRVLKEDIQNFELLTYRNKYI